MVVFQFPKFSESTDSHFRERAAILGLENADPLCAEATDRAKEGWLLNPAPLPHGAKLLLWISKRYNVPFIFGVLLADKLRACDDLEHSMANLACAVETPTHLLRCGNIDRISAKLAAGG